jgi:hypothetical protein
MCMCTLLMCAGLLHVADASKRLLYSWQQRERVSLLPVGCAGCLHAVSLTTRCCRRRVEIGRGHVYRARRSSDQRR